MSQPLATPYKGNNTNKPKKWLRVGSFLVSKDANEDGSKRYYIKVDNDVTLKAGETLSVFEPKEGSPEFVRFEICKNLQKGNTTGA